MRNKRVCELFDSRKLLLSVFIGMWLVALTGLVSPSVAFGQESSVEDDAVAVTQEEASGIEEQTITASDAEHLPDILLGAFARSDMNRTTQLVTSFDGVKFDLVNSIFKDTTPYARDDELSSTTPDNGLDASIPLDGSRAYLYNVCTNWCPSIMFYNGYFWIITNDPWSSADGSQLMVCVSYSKDLINWQDPQWCYIPFPADAPKDRFRPGENVFGAVAAEFALAPDNTPYIVVSVGTYGAYTGHPTQDSCSPYLVKINEMTPLKDPAKDPLTDSNIQEAITFSAEEAIPINLPSQAHDFIDGSLFFDYNGTTYLLMKSDQRNPEVWCCGDYTNLARAYDRSIWTWCSAAQYNNEAESLAKLNDTYFMYTDKIANLGNFGQSGTVVQTGYPWINGSWSAPQLIEVYDVWGNKLSISNRGEVENGPRHGTVITIRDPEAKAAVYNARERMGWSNPS